MAAKHPLRAPVYRDLVSRFQQPPANDRAELQRRLNYRFADPRWLDEALEHASLLSQAPGGRGRSSERLEFLGDRVLGLAVAHLLYETYPRETVGELARRHAALVCRDAIGRVALQLGLGTSIRMSKSEEEGGGRSNPSVLADTGEAVLAAIYLDGGFNAAQACIRRLWLPLLGECVEAPKDAKTALQEWAQGLGLPLPVYEPVSREGPAHSPVFVVSVSILGHGPAMGTGTSKRLAEQAAAGALLQRLRASAGSRTP